MSKDNSWPAFPNEGYARFEGMTLRDYFAAKAMAACISNMNANFGVSYEANNINLAMASYAIADAMLLVREK